MKLTTEQRKEVFDKYGGDTDKVKAELERLSNLDEAETSETTETKTAPKPKAKKKSTKAKKNTTVKDELNKRVHVQHKYTKRDVIQLLEEEEDVEFREDLKTESFKKTELEIYNRVEDRILLGRWDRELADLKEYSAIPEKERKEVHNSEIARIQNMVNTYNKVKAFRESKTVIPSTKQLDQAIIDVLALKLGKDHWFIKKASH